MVVIDLSCRLLNREQRAECNSLHTIGWVTVVGDMRETGEKDVEKLREAFYSIL